MLDMLINEQLIDLEGLFLLSYKKLKLNELQAVIVLITLHLENNKDVLITPKKISDYMSVNEKEVDKNIIILINCQILAIEGNSLTTKPLFLALRKVLSEPNFVEKSEDKVNLVKMFEREFNRALTPIEIDTLKEWKQCQYTDQMIIKALKEATLSNVHNMRYIEKILVDWAKHGIKMTGRDEVKTEQKVVDLVEYDWWNE